MYKPFIKKFNTALFFTALSCVVVSSASAKKFDISQELKITSSRQAADLKNKIFSYIDNVVITQGSMIIKADLVQVVSKPDSDEKTYIAKGKPATFQQILEDGKPINLEADEINYEQASNIIIISGNALLKQEGSEVRGSKITYNAETEYVNAESELNNQVKTVIQPTLKPEDKKKSEQ